MNISATSVAPRYGLQTLGNLFQLVALSGRDGRNLILLAIALTAAAAVADAASLALLQRIMSDPATIAMAKGRGGPAIAFAFLVAALVGTIFRLYAHRQTVRAQFSVNHSLAVRAFRILQYQNYADHLRDGASSGFATFERLQLISYHGLNSLISGLAASLSCAILLVAIAWLYPAAAGVMLLVLAVVAAETIWHGFSAKRGSLSDLARERSLLLYEARTAFRDIYLTNGQERICVDFDAAESAYRSEQARLALTGQSSRHTIEICGLLAAMAVIGVALLLPANELHLAPLLAVIALATFRLLPQVATLRSAFRLIALHADVSADVRALLERPLPLSQSQSPQQLRLRHRLTLTDLSVPRQDRDDTLRNLNLEIKRGSRIGIMGASGAGKSTLLDLICGANFPDSGNIQVDDFPLDEANAFAWRERIGVVSQAPILLGATLREAIIYPQHPDRVDAARFDAAIKGAGIADMVSTFANGLDTSVGEVTTALSGGQRQRLALAHALYRAHDMLILDEATGQLDEASETAIIDAIKILPRTLTIVVASHRPALFDICDTVYRLADGKLSRL